MGVVELQPIQIKLDRAPRVRCHQLAEVVGQLLHGEMVYLAIKTRANSADGARVCVDRLRLQSLEFEMLQMRRVVAFETLSI